MRILKSKCVLISVRQHEERFLQKVQVLHPTKHANGVLNRPRDFIVANVSVRWTNRRTEIVQIHSIQWHRFTEALQSDYHIIIAGVPVEVSYQSETCTLF